MNLSSDADSRTAESHSIPQVRLADSLNLDLCGNLKFKSLKKLNIPGLSVFIGEYGLIHLGHLNKNNVWLLAIYQVYLVKPLQNSFTLKLLKKINFKLVLIRYHMKLKEKLLLILGSTMCYTELFLLQRAGIGFGLASRQVYLPWGSFWVEERRDFLYSTRNDNKQKHT